jgi:arabinose-5-phosphate isomerase
LLAGVKQEGDDLNKPPRISILAEIIVLQCLSILLQQEEQLDLDKYYQWHPGGALGASLKELKEVDSK